MPTKVNKRSVKPDGKSVLFSELSKPAQRALAGKGISTLKQLSKLTLKEILDLHGIGKTAVPILKRLLAKEGLAFQKEKHNKAGVRTKPASVSDYLETLPADAKRSLGKIRKAILAAAPSAEEKISYGVPFYRQNGHLTAFLCNSSNCSLVTMSYEVVRKFKKELEPYKISGTTIHFPFNAPIPSALVKKIIKERLAENASKVKMKNKHK